MGALHFFNPGNDLALASGQRYYTPPAAAVTLGHAGTWLPLLLGNEGDFVLTASEKAPTDIYGKWAHGMSAWHGEEPGTLRPWGWSPWAMEYAANAFRKKGAAWNEAFEKEVDMPRLLELTHRRTSIAVHEALATGLTPVEAFSIGEAEAILRSWDKVVGKSPLSGSGRGVFHGSIRSADAFLRRCSATIARQGSVMIEHELVPVTEFAMLFEMKRETGIGFLGYSLFETSGDAYTSNILLPDEEIRQRLRELCPAEDFGALECRVTEAMRHIIGPIPYDGYFGVDMMIYRAETGTAVNPCIEVNMRTTMGVVAWKATHRLLHPASQGRFRLAVMPQEPAQAKWRDGRLADGSISLSPADSKVAFVIDAKSRAN
ncbi:MAG: hypothetical protein K2K76_10860 [Muribaculaceae bacterium]|nr:hypothetical protein [Muribaculaceae bacterium]